MSYIEYRVRDGRIVADEYEFEVGGTSTEEGEEEIRRLEGEDEDLQMLRDGILQGELALEIAAGINGLPVEPNTAEFLVRITHQYRMRFDTLLAAPENDFRSAIDQPESA